MRMPGLWELKTWTDFAEVTAFSIGHLPRAAGVLAAGLGPPPHARATTSTSSTTTSASATACSPSQRSGPPGARHDPPPDHRRPPPRDGARRDAVAAHGRRRRWYAFTKMQTRVAQRLERIITVSQNSYDRHLPRPRRRRPRSCSSCPSASTPTCSAPIPGIERRPHQIISTASADVAMKGQRYLLEALAKLRTEYPDLHARRDRPAQGRLGRASARSSSSASSDARRVRLGRHRRAHRRAVQRVGLRRRPVALRGVLAAGHRGHVRRRARSSPPPAARIPEVVGADGETCYRGAARRQRGARRRHPPSARRPRRRASASARPAASASSTAGAGATPPSAPSSTTGPCSRSRRPLGRSRSLTRADRRLRPPRPPSRATSSSTWARAPAATRSSRFRRGARGRRPRLRRSTS